LDLCLYKVFLREFDLELIINIYNKLMSHFCVAAAVLGMNLCENDTPIAAVEQSFINHVGIEGLNFATEEEYTFRLGVFQAKDAEINAINANPELTYTAAHNFFSTMTVEEIAKFEGHKADEDEVFVAPTILAETFLLETVDWRSKMNSVKNQGHCGSCWAFSAVQTIEGHHTIKTGKKQTFSEQQLVDCVYSRTGCDGGSHSGAQQYVQKHGLMTQSSYPYTGTYHGCKHSTGTAVKVTAFHSVHSKSVSQMKAALNKGPISVSVGTGTPFHHYSSGILNDKSCPTHTSHAIGAVGYGSNYWIVRNSWGSSWGERGYGRLAITGDGVGICAVQTKPDYSDTN
jgi:KDEL-tailed cysteine endopeptidase